MDTISQQYEQAHYLGRKHNAFIRRSKVTDNILYTVAGQVVVSTSWQEVINNLTELEK